MLPLLGLSIIALPKGGHVRQGRCLILLQRGDANSIYSPLSLLFFVHFKTDYLKEKNAGLTFFCDAKCLLLSGCDVVWKLQESFSCVVRCLRSGGGM